MGGKPSKGTPADKRLKENKPAATRPTPPPAPKTPPMLPPKPAPKKG